VRTVGTTPRKVGKAGPVTFPRGPVPVPDVVDALAAGAEAARLDAYGVARDDERIDHYRALWDAPESG
jgi:hypothetical protein